MPPSRSSARKGPARSTCVPAERSDYSAAGLYEYFGGKDEIIAEVCQQGHERLASHMRQADASLPVVDYLYEIGIGYIGSRSRTRITSS